MRFNIKTKKRAAGRDKDIPPGVIERGFTLIEVLVSLLLVTLAVVSISKMIITGIQFQRKSVTRFHLMQEMENFKNELNAKPFDSGELHEGNYSKKITPGALTLSWQITEISPTLKIIRLSISSKDATKRSYFYKSKYINNRDQS